MSLMYLLSMAARTQCYEYVENATPYQAKEVWHIYMYSIVTTFSVNEYSLIPQHVSKIELCSSITTPAYNA